MPRLLPNQNKIFDEVEALLSTSKDGQGFFVDFCVQRHP